MIAVVIYGMRLPDAEELPIRLYPGSDLCYHVYLDGNLVVSSLGR